MTTNIISRRELMGRGLKAGLAGVVGLTLPSTFLNKTCKGDEIVYNPGKLKFYNDISSPDMNGGYWPLSIIHRQGATDDCGTYDSTYLAPFDKPNTKIVSILETQEGKKELETDSRPLESFTPVNLELSVDTGEGAIDISCANNLWCSIDPNNRGYDFGVKPITLWRRFPAEPERLQFLADIREAFAKNWFDYYDQKFTAVPLPGLNGTFEDQVPYEFLQVRFDVYPGDFDLNGIVDTKDLALLGKDWGGRGRGAPLEHVGDITGPLGIPDGKVDGFDLELLTRYWLKNIRDIMP